jgi:hypothetical protein
LGLADLVNGSVRNGEVDFVGGRTCFPRTQAQVPEQGLGDSVVAQVLL